MSMLVDGSPLHEFWRTEFGYPRRFKFTTDNRKVNGKTTYAMSTAIGYFGKCLMILDRANALVKEHCPDMSVWFANVCSEARATVDRTLQIDHKRISTRNFNIKFHKARQLFFMIAFGVDSANRAMSKLTTDTYRLGDTASEMFMKFDFTPVGLMVTTYYQQLIAENIIDTIATNANRIYCPVKQEKLAHVICRFGSLHKQD